MKAREDCILDNFHTGEGFRSYDFFGCHPHNKGRFVFRVWAPHAVGVDLVILKDKEKTIAMQRLSDGECYEAECPAKEGDKYYYRILTSDGRKLKKADPYGFSFDLNDYVSVISILPERLDYPLLLEKTRYDVPINVYEVNLLSWRRHENGNYLTYVELERELVPYVKAMNYTHVEFMPVTEFPYDGSWGYQVTGYFSITSRLGTPLQFQSLINAFHKEGIKVILDWVPAHFPKDDWGLYEFDGQPLYECPLWDNMEHSGWGTRKFDFGRGEVDSFLLSGAYFLFDKFCIDGLRVDAVASMLYLDYDKPDGEYTPNVLGDNRNLQAIAWIQKLNACIKRDFPGAITIAEESTSFPKVTGELEEGGLGFDYKWNLGWMNDVLFYCRQDPYFRNHHHEKLTFSLMYAFSERFILPLSHDEVVHVKGAIVNKMPGEHAEKFAGERLLLGFMFAHPGKKLNFMGYEIAQFSEWDYRSSVEFFLTKFNLHAAMQTFVRELNEFYLKTPAFYERDFGWDGFVWLVVDDRYNNVLAFQRISAQGEKLTAVMNFSGVDLFQYRIGIEKGKYRVIFNTDEKKYGGNGKLKKHIFLTKKQASHGKDDSVSLDIPRLTCMYLIKEKN